MVSSTGEALVVFNAHEKPPSPPPPPPTPVDWNHRFAKEESHTTPKCYMLLKLERIMNHLDTQVLLQVNSPVSSSL